MIEKKSAPKRGPTMEDVARAAGVNRVTVSMALRGNTDGTRNGTRISEATRQRILAVARDLGYSRSAIAMAFRQQRTDIIGFYAGMQLLPNLHLPFFAEILSAFQHACTRHQKDLLLYSDITRQSTNEIYSALAGGKIDGLVVLPTPINPIIEKLAHSHLPAVAIANEVPEIPSVLIDDEHGSQLIVAHLVRQGHRRVMYRIDAVGHSSPERRRRAFLRTAADAGLDIVISSSTLPFDRIDEPELEILRAPAPRRPTAAVGWGDMSAYTLIEACLGLGLRIPDDIAIIGFDGIPTFVPPLRRLTTIRAPWSKVAETALDYVMALISGQAVPMRTILPVELQLGETG